MRPMNSRRVGSHCCEDRIEVAIAACMQNMAVTEQFIRGLQAAAPALGMPGPDCEIAHTVFRSQGGLGFEHR
jgi:hypothetical protein